MTYMKKICCYCPLCCAIYITHTHIYHEKDQDKCMLRFYFMFCMKYITHTHIYIMTLYTQKIKINICCVFLCVR